MGPGPRKWLQRALTSSLRALHRLQSEQAVPTSQSLPAAGEGPGHSQEVAQLGCWPRSWSLRPCSLFCTLPATMIPVGMSLVMRGRGGDRFHVLEREPQLSPCLWPYRMSLENNHFALFSLGTEGFEVRCPNSCCEDPGSNLLFNLLAGALDMGLVFPTSVTP